MKIRKARTEDFEELYALGSMIPELRVSVNEPFMDKGDFLDRISSGKDVFLVAEEEERIVGFILANAKDADRPLRNKFACLVYIAVEKNYRDKGIGTRLYSECLRRLRKSGITHLYAWANVHSQSIQAFLKQRKFRGGKKFVWMDRKL